MPSTPAGKESIERYSEDLKKAFATQRMVVFLCGPALTETRPGAMLRKRIRDELEKENFEVVLGEDDGLENLRLLYGNFYAHENELAFLTRHCNAIVLIADSLGSYCELGLFAYIHAHDRTKQWDFVLVIDQQFKDVASYLNQGPAKAVSDFGVVYYEDLAAFDSTKILNRLAGRRAVTVFERRGRPRKKRK